MLLTTLNQSNKVYILETRNEDSKQEKYKIKLLRYAFKDSFNLDYDNLEIEKNEYGKPRLKNYPNIQFNISHCEGMLVCVVGNSLIGIDIEKIRDFDIYVAKRVCSVDELMSIESSKEPNAKFFTLWTLKESLGKALGVGINYCMKNTDFKINADKIECNFKDYNFLTERIKNEYVLSIAYKI